MENQKYSYISTKFSIDNIKTERNKLLKNGTLTGFDLLENGKEVVTKEYYDTSDFFFSQKGITINKNILKGSNMAKLIVRYQNTKQRIEFLSNMPEVFEKHIPVKDSILKYNDFIAECILELVPYGLDVDVKNVLNNIRNVFSSKKRRLKYRYINMGGLKVTVYFTKAEYTTPLNREKENLLMLEINSDNKETKADYDTFIKKVKFDNPELIQLEGSDYLLGKSLLFDKN